MYGSMYFTVSRLLAMKGKRTVSPSKSPQHTVAHVWKFLGPSWAPEAGFREREVTAT